jgi:hypothetical protein
MSHSTEPGRRLILAAVLSSAATGGACRDDPKIRNDPDFRKQYATNRKVWAREGIPEKDMPSYGQWLDGWWPGRGANKGKLVMSGWDSTDLDTSQTRTPEGAGGEGGGGGEGGH